MFSSTYKGGFGAQTQPNCADITNVQFTCFGECDGQRIFQVVQCGFKLFKYVAILNKNVQKRRFSVIYFVEFRLSPTNGYMEVVTGTRLNTITLPHL